MAGGSRPRQYAAAASAALLALLATALGGTPPSDADTTARHVVFTISSPLITESSSLVVSTVHPGLVYTANDSGDTATVYVLDSSDGRLVGETTLSGVDAVDFEAMAGGNDGSLVIGDIGDNHATRSSVALYKIAQPGRGDASVTPKSVSVTYPGGPRNAESLLYDAGTGRAYIASKQFNGAKVYQSPPHVFQRTHVRMTPIAHAPVIATDATFIRGQRYAVIRTYFGAFVYHFPSWKRVTSFDLPTEPQGESVAAPPGGRSLWIGSEGLDSAVLRVRLPDLTPTTPPTTAPTTTLVTTQTERVPAHHDPQLTSLAWVVLAAAGGALVVLVAVGLVLRHRRQRARARAA